MYCDEYCDYCAYNTIVCDPHSERLMVACDYIGCTGHRRPCKPGSLCTVRRPIAEKHNTWSSTSTKRRYRERVSKTLNGKQSAVILEFMQKNGYTTSKMAEVLHLHRETIRCWVREASFANWDDLAAIGLIKPDDVPTSTEGPED